MRTLGARKLLSVISATFLVTLAIPGTAFSDKAAEPLTTKAKIESFIQSAPFTTNLASLEIYDAQRDSRTSWQVRRDVLQLPCIDEGATDVRGKFFVLLQLSSSNRFYIQELERFKPGSQRYYGPFEGDPFKMFGTTQRKTTTVRDPKSPLINPAAAEPDNPLGLDREMIIRLFETGKRLRSTAMMVSQWSASHHLRIPTTVDEVYAQYINRQDLANDPFSDSKFHIKEAEGKIQVYSVGPDGTWDDGKTIDSADPSLKGDLGVEIEIDRANPKFLLEGALLEYVKGTHTARYLAAKSQRAETPSTQSNPIDSNLHFGKITDGLSAAVELLPTNGAAHGKVTIDETIELRFHIRNETNYNIQIASPEWRQNDTASLEDETGQPAKDERGRLTVRSLNHYSGISPIRREILKPGESIVLRSTGLAFTSPGASWSTGYSFTAKPGRYGIRFTLLFPGWNAELMDWRGQLETGVAPIELLPAAGNTNPVAAGPFASAAPVSDTRPAYFSGRVVDDATGTPLTNFWVQMGSTTSVTHHEFAWRPEFNGASSPSVNSPECGKFWAETYQVDEGGVAWARVLADGYLPQPVTPEPMKCPVRLENLEIRLKRGREVRGTVRDHDGRPVAGARLFLAGLEAVNEAKQQQWFQSTTAVSDNEGRFKLAGAGAEGQYVTAFSKEGVAAAPIPIPAAGHDLEVSLP
jgi:hypothetical protein